MKSLVFMIALFLGINSASAQSCTNFYEAKRKLQDERNQLLWQYKGTAATALACAGVCMDQPQDQIGGCVLVSCGVACLFVGLENCVNFISQNYTLEQQSRRLDTYGRTNGCNS